MFRTLLALLVVSGTLRAAAPLAVASPDGQLVVRLSLPGAPQGGLGLAIERQRHALVTADLGWCIGGTDLLAEPKAVGVQSRASDSTYRVPFGKNNPIRDHFRELTVDLESTGRPAYRFELVIRAYDDGVAFRYVLPPQAGGETVEVTDEPTRFHLAGDPRCWPLYRESYTTSHEGRYRPAPATELATNQLIDLPLLAEYANGVAVAFAEAGLTDYAGLYLKAEATDSSRRLRCDLSPLPGQRRVKVRATLPLATPWRVWLVGAAPGRLLESNLLGNLNPPCAIADTSWIKPGKASFYWWSGVQEPFDVPQAVQWEKAYIDFCARSGFAFHTVIGTEGDHPWYYQSRAGYDPPGPDADLTRPRTGFPLEDVIAYGRRKGIGIRVWVDQKALWGRLEPAFTQYEKWGLAGLMVDFLDRNDQEMVRFAHAVLESAARHHLNLQFHGVWAPTGLSRTYPNLMNHEGVLNLEYLKWSDRCAPEHDVTVPFTRMVAGPMDYHLGGFRGATRAGFAPRNLKPVVFGTRCLMLAMYVVYENPMPMVCDTPDTYAGQPGFDFLCAVPTTWDETRVLQGEVGNDIVVARRHGAGWYVGAMTDWTPRTLSVPLAFLPPGRYQVEAWADALDSPDPNQLVFRKQTLTSRDTLELRLAGGGGQVLRITPVRR